MTEEGLDRLVWGITGERAAKAPGVEARKDPVRSKVEPAGREEESFDFELGIESTGKAGGAFRVLVQSPLGEASNSLDLTLPEPRSTFLDVAAAMALGGQLFHSLFAGPARDMFLQSLGMAESRGARLRIHVRFDLGDPALGSLLACPWELLYRAETREFLALSSQTPIARLLSVPRPATPFSLDGPPRVLAVACQDLHSPPLDLAQELRWLAQAGQLELHQLQNPSLDTLRQTLARSPYDILHFMGNGQFNAERGEGSLIFVQPGGAPEAVSGRHFATKIRGSRSLKLILLNACETGVAGARTGHDAFAGVATALVLAGIPHVLAHQAPLSDHDAISFSAAFYESMSRSRDLEVALTEGRQAVYSRNPQEASWATPVLYSIG